MTALARDCILAAAALACGWMWGNARGHDEVTATRVACVYTLDRAHEALAMAHGAVTACVEATGAARWRTTGGSR